MYSEIQEFLTNIKKEFGENLDNIDIESVKKAAEIILESEKVGGRAMSST